MEGIGFLYDPLGKYLDKVDKYNRFVYRSILFLLSNSSVLRKYERELTVVSLMFLEKADDNVLIEIVSKLVSETSKTTQLYLADNYQKLLEVLYNNLKL